MNWDIDEFHDVVLVTMDVFGLASKLLANDDYDMWWELFDGPNVSEYCCREEERQYARK